jgi:hypothetical protein
MLHTVLVTSKGYVRMCVFVIVTSDHEAR